jgi:hypothetical protein
MDVKKLSKKAIEAAINARVQRATVGFLIPMLSIPKLSAVLKAAIAEGKSDEELKAILAAFPGVEPSNR